MHPSGVVKETSGGLTNEHNLHARSVGSRFANLDDMEDGRG